MTRIRPTTTFFALGAIGLLVLFSCATPGSTESAAGKFENLQVLAPDTTDDELSEIMLGFLSGLGLPRRAGRGCLHCHEGSLDEPRTSWDYAADTKPAKAQARVMMRMVSDINRHLDDLTPRPDASSRVTCYSCHSGRLNPKPLHDVLMERYESGGVGELSDTYRELRTRYFGADAYDFKPHTLRRIAEYLVEQSEFDDAVAIHGLNAEHSEDPSAIAGVVVVRLEQTFSTAGTDAMIARYHELKNEHPSEAFHPLPLGGLGWKLFRAGHREAGFRLFELNHAENPDSFVANENLAWGCFSMERFERAVELAEEWVAAHPEHESGRLMRDEIVRKAER